MDNRQANILKYKNSEERRKFLNQSGKIAKVDFFRRNCHKFIKTGEKIIDIGGGAGVWADIIREKGITANIYAVDISADALGERNEKDISIVSDMENIPYSDNFFDRAMFFASLHHVRNTNKALLEAKRIVKNSGYIFLYEPVSLRLLLTGKNLAPTADGVEYNLSLNYLRQEIKKLDGQVEYRYFEGFIKRFFKNSSADFLKIIIIIEEFINKIPVINYLAGFFSDTVIFVIKVSK